MGVVPIPFMLLLLLLSLLPVKVCTAETSIYGMEPTILLFAPPSPPPPPPPLLLIPPTVSSMVLLTTTAVDVIVADGGSCHSLSSYCYCCCHYSLSCLYGWDFNTEEHHQAHCLHHHHHHHHWNDAQSLNTVINQSYREDGVFSSAVVVLAFPFSLLPLPLPLPCLLLLLLLLLLLCPPPSTCHLASTSLQRQVPSELDEFCIYSPILYKCGSTCSFLSLSINVGILGVFIVVSMSRINL